MAVRKLTPALLRKIVLEERARVINEKKLELGLLDDAITLDPEDFGTDKALEAPKDFTVKEAKRTIEQIELIESNERALLQKLRDLREQKTKMVKKLRK